MKMKRRWTGILALLLLAVSVVAFSIWLDVRKHKNHWAWFQRSGSIVVLLGAILTYRSIVRLGVEGAGGAPVLFFKAKLISTDDTAPVQKVDIELDAETIERLAQEKADKVAVVVGAIVIVVGTIIWGYGDLVGKLFQ